MEMEMPKVTKQEMLNAIREGVEDAMWRMITNATDAPCGDFFYFVKEGVSDGISKSCGVPRDVEITGDEQY